MKTILEYILQHEGITNTRLAAILEVAPASISHIMSGRNKPSFDFLVKLVEAFPQYDARWILTGKGEPLPTSSAQKVVDGELQLFSFIPENQNENRVAEPLPENNLAEVKNPATTPTLPGTTRLIVCFPDHTFVEYEKR